MGTLVGLALLGFAISKTRSTDARLKNSYHCKRCDAKLPSAEPDDTNELHYRCTNELHYRCVNCHVEYRVKT